MGDEFGLELTNTVYARDSTTKAAVKMHTLHDLRGNIPIFIRTSIFLTNNVEFSAETVCALYKNRWHAEPLCKWIKRFFGTTENAVKTQIWIAVAVYVLIAIVKKRLHLKASLDTLLQVFSVALFEKMPIESALSGSNLQNATRINDK